jgi:tRNA C32,U32 (ribose-2'-O)-methylase TrmJ
MTTNIETQTERVMKIKRKGKVHKAFHEVFLDFFSYHAKINFFSSSERDVDRINRLRRTFKNSEITESDYYYFYNLFTKLLEDSDKPLSKLEKAVRRDNLTIFKFLDKEAKTFFQL